MVDFSPTGSRRISEFMTREQVNLVCLAYADAVWDGVTEDAEEILRRIAVRIEPHFVEIKSRIAKDDVDPNVIPDEAIPGAVHLTVGLILMHMEEGLRTLYHGTMAGQATQPVNLTELLRKDEFEKLLRVCKHPQGATPHPELLEILQPIWPRINESINRSMGQPADTENSIEYFAYAIEHVASQHQD